VNHREITGRHITLEEVMRPAISVRQDTRAGDALKVMLDNGVPGIPVVNDRGYLVGFIHDAHLLAGHDAGASGPGHARATPPLLRGARYPRGGRCRPLLHCERQRHHPRVSVRIGTSTRVLPADEPAQVTRAFGEPLEDNALGSVKEEGTSQELTLTRLRHLRRGLRLPLARRPLLAGRRPSPR
jgi:CBS domain protein